MKKIGYIAAWVIEAAALAGAWAVHYFAQRKLGMIRYLNYKNQSWERDYPVEFLQNFSVAAVILLTAAVLFWTLRKRRQISGLTAWMNGGMVLLSAGYAGYVFLNAGNVPADYYFVGLLLLAAAAVQILKTGAAVLTTKRRGM